MMYGVIAGIPHSLLSFGIEGEDIYETFEDQ